MRVAVSDKLRRRFRQPLAEFIYEMMCCLIKSFWDLSTAACPRHTVQTFREVNKFNQRLQLQAAFGFP
jgi:hypothetical protein